MRGEEMRGDLKRISIVNIHGSRWEEVSRRDDGGRQAAIAT
jgi:hypothetical protein